jgi:hypothetical protein
MDRVPFQGGNPGIVIGKSKKNIKRMCNKFKVKISVKSTCFLVEATTHEQNDIEGAVSEIIRLLGISIKNDEDETQRIEDDIERKKRINELVENHGYCTFHRRSGCPCPKDIDGRVKNGDNYPFEKLCPDHNSLKCDCPRLPNGESIAKITQYHMNSPVKYCNLHSTWYCICKRDKYGNVMSPIEGYPIETYCGFHNCIDCECIRNGFGKVVKNVLL